MEMQLCFIEMRVRTLDFKIKALDCDAAFIVTAAVSIKLDWMETQPVFLISADINQR